ncbi:MAG: type VI secretion system ATPase TssH, partial [Verrucomicrobia bacterium]|nr:type VI secretion system ATPase TssH [Verrucomicrobiota bacterium]
MLPMLRKGEILAIPRKSLFGKLGLTAFRSIESATAFCKLRGNPYIELVHWLHQILQGGDSDIHRIARHFAIASRETDRELADALARLPGGATSISNFAPHIETAIERAWVIATLAFGDNRIRTSHLLLALLQTPELRLACLDICPSFRRIPIDTLAGILPTLVAQSPEQHEPAQDGIDLAPALPGEASGAIVSPGGNGSALDKYSIDLTQLARDGRSIRWSG